MAEPDKKEEIVIKLDGKIVPLESLTPELKVEVERRIKESRELYASKYPKDKLRMNINVKVKTSAAAKKAAGEKPPLPSVVVDDGPAIPYLIQAVLLAAVLGGLYAFVPAFTNAVDKALAALHRTKAPAAPATK